MSKKRKGVSLSEENAEWLSAQDNASALIDRLVTQYRNGGGDKSVMLDIKTKEVEADVDYYRKKLEASEDKLDEMEKRRERAVPAWQKTVNEAVEIIDGPITDVQAKNFAEKADMSVEEFKEEYEEARQ